MSPLYERSSVNDFSFANFASSAKLFLMKRMIAILFSGVIWFTIGVTLLMKGFRLIILNEKALLPDQQKYAIYLIGLGLLIGFIKGRFILIKTVQRLVTHILELPTPFKFRRAYPPKYFLLIISMMLLGISMNLLSISPNVRGVIDVAIGSALINGAMIYVRFALALRNSERLFP